MSRKKKPGEPWTRLPGRYPIPEPPVLKIKQEPEVDVIGIDDGPKTVGKPLLDEKTGLVKRVGPYTVGDLNEIIDDKMMRQMFHAQCSLEEVAGYFGITKKELIKYLRHRFGRRWAMRVEEFRFGGRASLRRRQFENALRGDTQMLIWLGRNYLTQSPKNDVQISVDDDTRQAAGRVADLLLAKFRTVRGG